jgi:pyruvate kinase
MQFNKTKIVCTIGPSSASRQMLSHLMKAGMDAARLNFSHGTHDEKREQIKLVRELANNYGYAVPIIADMQGPKLRLGAIDGKREILKGQAIVLTYGDTEEDLPMQIDLSKMVDKGHRIFLNDGLIELKVIDIAHGKITTVARNSGWVSSFKGINIPDTAYTQETFTEKDKSDLAFVMSQNVEYVALSFVRSHHDVDTVRQIIEKHASSTKIYVKIERNEAVKNLESILRSCDGVMIARGDLAIETSPEMVPILQQKIIRMARQLQKPVIVATQMLESMIENPRPTRAEASDVAHAVLHQVDAVMLSAESASGKYPIEAVHVMGNIIRAVEATPEFKHYIKINWEQIDSANLRSSAIASSAASLAYKIKAPLLAVGSSTGKTIAFIASFRPDAQIIAVTHDRKTQNQLALVWGTYPIVVKPTPGTEAFWQRIATEILKNKLGKQGEKVVMVAGSKIGITGATDTIKVTTL